MHLKKISRWGIAFVLPILALSSIINFIQLPTAYAGTTSPDVDEQFTYNAVDNTITAHGGGLAGPITLDSGEGDFGTFSGQGRWRENTNCFILVTYDPDSSTGGPRSIPSDTGRVRVSYQSYGTEGCTRAGQTFSADVTLTPVTPTEENCVLPNTIVNGECIQAPTGNGGFEGGGVNTAGCPGSNAPLDAVCANIPAGCPGSTQQAPGATPANCPYEALGGEYAGEGEEETADECPVGGFDPFRWAYCPIFRVMGVFTNTLDHFIDEYLTTGNRIFETDRSDTSANVDENSYRQAWETFRNFGLALVIIAGLIMLASEAFGFEFIDAYTVRKVLPRLIIAIIGISLSWEICRFLVGFFDSLGRAAGSIIYSSFNIGDEGINIWALISAQLLLAGAATAAAFLLTGLGVLSLVGTLILSMVVAVVVLVMRQVIIIVCVILSPLAIAAFILQGTSKLSYFWGSTLGKMLALYPIITGLIALCKVLGKITLQNPTDAGGILGQLISIITGIILFMLGYFLIPAAARWGGGVLATVSGAVNDRSRGAFDRLRNFRKGRMEGRVAQLQSGEAFKSGAIGDRLNNFTKNATAFGKSRYKGAFLLNKGVRETAIAEHDEMLRQQHAKSAAGAGNMFKDPSLRAQAAGRTEEEARRNLDQIYGMRGAEADEAIDKAYANGGFGAIRQQHATIALAATGTGYDNLGQMAQQIALTANGNDDRIETMVGAMRGVASKSGRYDLGGAGHGTVSGLAKEAMASGGLKGPKESSVTAALVEAGISTTNNALVQGKPKSTSEIANALSVSLTAAHTKAAEAKANAAKATGVTRVNFEQEAATYTAEAGELAAKINNLQGAAPFATEVNLSAMNINRTRANGKDIVAGNVGFESEVVKATVTQIGRAAGQAERVKDTNADGTIRVDVNGRPVMVENKEWVADLQSYRRNNTTRGGGDPSDPRWSSAKDDDEAKAA